MKVTSVASLLVTISVVLLAQSTYGQDLPVNLDAANNGLTSPLETLARASTSSVFGELDPADACDPRHPSNQYLIQFKENTLQLLQSVCQYQANVVDPASFDFASAKAEIQRLLLVAKEAADNSNIDLGNAADIAYLQSINETTITNFLDKYAEFVAEYQNVICDQALQFMTAIGFLTVGTTDTAFLAEMTTLLEGYVELVERNTPQQLEEDFTVESALWGLDRVDQIDRLPRDNTLSLNGQGAGVHLYIIDTGIRLTHNEFTGRIGNGFDAVDNDLDPTDCQGHGTHCAATAGGTQYGIAKLATIHGVRVLNCQGSGFSSQTVQGMDWVVANKVDPAIASMSLGGGANSASNNAVGRMYDAGVAVSVAGGNHNGDACTRSPASAPRAFTVGSTTSSDSRSGFSAFGTCVNIFAPGSGIKSAWFQSDTQTNTISGTSMACPHVSGAMAVYRGLNPSATPQETYDATVAIAAVDKVSNHCPGCASVQNNLLLQVTFPPTCVSDPAVPDANCVASPFSEFGTCSTTCGPGTQTRTRTILTPATGCGTCPEQFRLTETRACEPANAACPQAEPTWMSQQTNPLQNKMLTLTPNAEGTAYEHSWCDQPAFVYDTTTHERLTMQDEATEIITFGAPMKFFQTTKTTGRLCDNGFMYFSETNLCTWQRSLERHFGDEMIAFLRDDYNPPAGGVITVSTDAEFPDRKIITFLAVPVWINLPSVSFQAELIYDTGVIKITWGFIVSTSSTVIVGVSQGTTARGSATPAGYESIVPTAGTACPVPNAASPPPPSPPPPSPPPSESPTTSPTASPTAAPTDSPTASPTTLSPTASPTATPTASPTTPAPTPEPILLGDLPDVESIPATYFSWRSNFLSRKHRHLLQNGEDGAPPEPNQGADGQSLFSAGSDDKDAEGAQSTFKNGVKEAVEGKSFTLYPTQREDTTFTAWDYRVSCVLDSLAEWDEAGFSALSMGDDSYSTQSLTGSVKFGGTSAAAVFVGSNGYITFGTGDRSFWPTISRHYSKNRVSAAYTDLNPRLGGTVRFKDSTTSDGKGFFTVWWDDVPRYGGASDIYNMQIKFMQTGPITMMYKTIPVTWRPVVMGVSTNEMPREYKNNLLTNLENPAIPCGLETNLMVAIPITDRSPTQEFSTSRSRRHLLQGAADPVYEEELQSAASAPEDPKTPTMEGQSGSTNSFDLVGRVITYAPLPPLQSDPQTGYEIACNNPITDYPVDPSGGTDIMPQLGDDDSERVSFTGGKVFTFMGVDYTDMYVGSNGYITFGRGDWRYYSHRYYHYLYPRISGMFYDLNPRTSPSDAYVKVQQKEDSIVVTYNRIKTWSGSFYNSFQIELFFTKDGMAQPFTIAYKEVTTNSKRVITGASAGALYRTTHYSRFRIFDISAVDVPCTPEGGAAGGSLGVLNSGERGGSLSGDDGSIGGLSVAGDSCPAATAFNFTSVFSVVGNPPAPTPAATTTTPVPPAPTAGAGSHAASLLLAALASVAALLLLA